MTIAGSRRCARARSEPGGRGPNRRAQRHIPRRHLSEEHDECVRMTFEQAIDLARFPEYVTELESLEARLYAR